MQTDAFFQLSESRAMPSALLASETASLSARLSSLGLDYRLAVARCLLTGNTEAQVSVSCARTSRRLSVSYRAKTEQAAMLGALSQLSELLRGLEVAGPGPREKTAPAALPPQAVRPIRRGAVPLLVRGLSVLLVGCTGAAGNAAPPRSPSHDYAPTPTLPSDGRVAGADETPPEDKLQTSPRLGSDGVKPAGSPIPPRDRATRNERDDE
jgi:hypothetical protein